MPTATRGGSSDTEVKAITVVPMSSRPSRTVTRATPVANPETASVNSTVEITAIGARAGSADVPGPGQAQRTGGGQPEPVRDPGQRSPGLQPGPRGGAVVAGLGRAQTVQRRRVREDPHGGVGRETGLLTGDVQSDVEAAEFVDEPVATGVGPGPHPAPGQFVNLLAGHVAAFGDLRGEVVIDPVEGGVDPLPLAVAEVLRGAEHARVGAVLDAADADTETLQQIADDGLPDHNADGPRERARLGDDRVGRHRDVVAAGCGEVAHRNDDRLTRPAGEYDLTPDGVGGHRGTPRAVHAEHDRLDPVVPDGRPEPGADRVGAHGV